MKKKNTSIRAQIKATLQAQPNQTQQGIAQSINVPEKKIARYIKYMERSGEIDCTSGAYTNIQHKTIVGTIEITRGGFGFVTAEDKKQFPEDIFIPAHATGGAMSGDTVRVRLEKSKPHNSREGTAGKVEEILKRRSTMIVGLVEEIDGHYYVDPFEDGMHMLIPLSDPAKLGLKDRDVVVCKIVDSQQMKVKLHAKLGSMADENIDVLIASVRFGVMMGYSKEMNDEALEVIRQHKNNTDGRHSHNAMFTITIDGATSKDFDDAISLEYIKKTGEYHLYVHVADVTHYVRPGSVIDEDALRRGTSVYLPTYTSHMLPEILAGDICSLKPGRERFAMTAHIVFDKNGKRLKGSIRQTVITSNQRLTYDYVNQIINEEILPKDEQLLKQINLMYDFSEILRTRRLGEGYIEFKSEEPYFYFDENWKLVGLTPKQSGKAEKLIEMFMLEANELAAHIINEEYGYGVFRIHPDPDPKNIMAFKEFCTLNSIKLPHINPENITSKGVQSMVKAVEGHPMESLLTPMLIRSMQKASYDTNSTTHFALSSQEYTHFTSPIRRYPDIIVHRLLKNIQDGRPPTYTRSEITTMLETCNRREDMATSAQRYCETFKKLQLIAGQHGHKTYEAHITRIVPHAIAIYLPKIMLRGVVPFSAMDYKHFETSKSKMMVTVQPDNVKLKVGGSVNVSLHKVKFTTLEAEMILSDLNDETANPFHTLRKQRGKRQHGQNKSKSSNKKRGKRGRRK